MKNILSLSDAVTVFRNLAGACFLGCFLKGRLESLPRLHRLRARKSQLKPPVDSIIQAASCGSPLKPAPSCLQADEALAGHLAVFGLGFGETMGRKTQRVGHETETSPRRNEEVSIVVICMGERSRWWQYGTWLCLPYRDGVWIRSGPRILLVRDRNS